MDSQPTTQSKSALLGLPTELRLNIYSHFWSQSCKRRINIVISPNNSEPTSTLRPLGFYQRTTLPPENVVALMLTCKRINAEVQDLVANDIQVKIKLQTHPPFRTTPLGSQSLDFLRSARSVKMEISYDTEGTRLHSRHFLHGFRAVLEVLDRNERLRSFCVGKRLFWGGVEELVKTTAKLAAVNRRLDGEEGGKLDGGWRMLLKMEEVFEEELNATQPG